MSICLSKIYDFNGKAEDIAGLFKDKPYLFFLHSSLVESFAGRYSFIGFDPFDKFSSNENQALYLLKEKSALLMQEDKKGISPLTSGIVGFISYDYGLKQEKIELKAQDDLNLPYCVFGFYDCIITIDHFLRTIIISSTGLPEKDRSLRQKRAEKRLKDIDDVIELFLNKQNSLCNKKKLSRGNENIEFKCNFTKNQYFKAVDKVLEYIEAGDIYQVNLSQRFEFDLKNIKCHSFDIYKELIKLSPVDYSGYFDCGDLQLISDSPEEFLYLDNNIVRTRPMKGTRPRGEDDISDNSLREELEHSAKDKAELLMVTDLERNDIGKVCRYGTVRVKDMRTIEEYKTVFQTTSTVEGEIQKGKDCFDLLAACFPGGSITGCPKIRAMEIIEELEPTRRGVYTGSLGYINFAGNMNFNILIRTLLSYRRKLYFQVGGGIVYDSTPEGEYNETLVKAKAMQTCLKSLSMDPAELLKI